MRFSSTFVAIFILILKVSSRVKACLLTDSDSSYKDEKSSKKMTNYVTNLKRDGQVDKKLYLVRPKDVKLMENILPHKNVELSIGSNGNSVRKMCAAVKSDSTSGHKDAKLINSRKPDKKIVSAGKTLRKIDSEGKFNTTSKSVKIPSRKNEDIKVDLKNQNNKKIIRKTEPEMKLSSFSREDKEFEKNIKNDNEHNEKLKKIKRNSSFDAIFPNFENQPRKISDQNGEKSNKIQSSQLLKSVPISTGKPPRHMEHSKNVSEKPLRPRAEFRVIAESPPQTLKSDKISTKKPPRELTSAEISRKMTKEPYHIVKSVNGHSNNPLKPLTELSFEKKPQLLKLDEVLFMKTFKRLNLSEGLTVAEIDPLKSDKVTTKKLPPQHKPGKVLTDNPTRKLKSYKVPTDNPTQQLESENVPTDNPTRKLKSNKVPIDNPTRQLESENAPIDTPTQQLEPDKVLTDNPTQKLESDTVPAENPTQQLELYKVQTAEPPQQLKSSKISAEKPPLQLKSEKITTEKPPHRPPNSVKANLKINISADVAVSSASESKMAEWKNPFQHRSQTEIGLIVDKYMFKRTKASGIEFYSKGITGSPDIIAREPLCRKGELMMDKKIGKKKGLRKLCQAYVNPLYPYGLVYNQYRAVVVSNDDPGIKCDVYDVQGVWINGEKMRWKQEALRCPFKESILKPIGFQEEESKVVDRTLYIITGEWKMTAFYLVRDENDGDLRFVNYATLRQNKGPEKVYLKYRVDYELTFKKCAEEDKRNTKNKESQEEVESTETVSEPESRETRNVITEHFAKINSEKNSTNDITGKTNYRFASKKILIIITHYIAKIYEIISSIRVRNITSNNSTGSENSSLEITDEYGSLKIKNRIKYPENCILIALLLYAEKLCQIISRSKALKNKGKVSLTSGKLKIRIIKNKINSEGETRVTKSKELENITKSNYKSLDETFNPNNISENVAAFKLKYTKKSMKCYYNPFLYNPEHASIYKQFIERKHSSENKKNNIETVTNNRLCDANNKDIIFQTCQHVLKSLRQKDFKVISDLDTRAECVFTEFASNSTAFEGEYYANAMIDKRVIKNEGDRFEKLLRCVLTQDPESDMRNLSIYVAINHFDYLIFGEREITGNIAKLQPSAYFRINYVGDGVVSYFHHSRT